MFQEALNSWIAVVDRWTYLCIIDLAGTKERIERIVSGKQEAGKVDEKGACNVEKDEEEV